MKKDVLIVGGIRPIHKKIRELGHDTSLIVSAHNADGQDFKEEYRFVLVVPEGAGINVWIDLARTITSAEAVTHIAGFHDDDQDKAIAIASALNLNFWVNSNSLDWTRNKSKMRERLRACGLDEVFSCVANNHDELKNCLGKGKLPLIVKPISGAASRGVMAVKNREDALALLDPSDLERVEYPVVVEQYLEGEEFSVEGFSGGGIHRFWGITRKSKFAGGFVESGHEFPAVLEPKVAKRILAYVGDCLTALGILHGATHTEIIMTADGKVHIVETHTRLGGDRIVDLVRLVTGEDPFLISAQHATGELAEDYFTRNVQHQGAAVVRFLAAQGSESGHLGRLGSVNGPDKARHIPLVKEVCPLKTVGDVLAPLASSFDRLALAVAHGATHVEAEQACLHALSDITFLEQVAVPIKNL